MTQTEANKKMIGLFEAMADKAENADSKEERFEFTDAAHKLFITLTQIDAFDSAATSDGGFKN